MNLREWRLYGTYIIKLVRKYIGLTVIIFANDIVLLFLRTTGIPPLFIVLWIMCEYKHLEHSVDFRTSFSSYSLLDLRRDEAQTFLAFLYLGVVLSARNYRILSRILVPLRTSLLGRGEAFFGFMQLCKTDFLLQPEVISYS